MYRRQLSEERRTREEGKGERRGCGVVWSGVVWCGGVVMVSSFVLLGNK